MAAEVRPIGSALSTLQKPLDAEAPRLAAHTQPLVQPSNRASNRNLARSVKEPAEDQPPQQLDRPWTLPRLARTQNPDRNTTCSGSLYSAGQTAVHASHTRQFSSCSTRVGRDSQVAFGQRSGHANPPARPFGLVQCQHVGRTSTSGTARSECRASMFFILVTQKWVGRFEELATSSMRCSIVVCRKALRQRRPRLGPTTRFQPTNTLPDCSSGCAASQRYAPGY